MITVTVEFTNESYARTLWLLRERYGKRRAPEGLCKLAILEIATGQAEKVVNESICAVLGDGAKAKES